MKITDNATLDEIAVAFNERTPDPTEATKLMTKWLEDRPAILKRVLADGGLYALCQYRIGVMRKQSSDSAVNICLRRDEEKPTVGKNGWREPDYSKNNLSADAVAKMLAPSMDRIFTKYYVGKKFLGDATKADLLLAAEDREAEAHGGLQKAHWYRKLASGMSDKDTVRKRYKVAQVAEFLHHADPIAHQTIRMIEANTKRAAEAAAV